MKLDLLFAHSTPDPVLLVPRVMRSMGQQNSDNLIFQETALTTSPKQR
jgi:hypothetical protein